jgi:phosphopantetheinyl transferase (holo-ACP synthase)
METITQKECDFLDDSPIFSIFFEDIRQLPLGDYLSIEEFALYKWLPVSKQKDYLAGRYSAKKVLREYTKREHARDVALKDIIIMSNPGRGVQFTIFGDALEIPAHLSISHCNERGVAVLASAPLGVDIEEIRIFKVETLCAFLTPQEKVFLCESPSKDHPLVATLFWSFKEAYLKALGKGIIIHPRTVNISLGRDFQFQGLSHNGVSALVQGEWRTFDDRHILTRIKTI